MKFSKLSTSLLLPTTMALASPAHAQEAVPENEAEGAPSTSAPTNAAPAAPPEPVEKPASTDSVVKVPPKGASEPKSTEASSAETKRLLYHFAEEAATRRFAEATVGLATSGSTFGIGFVAQAPNMSWAHTLWVSGGIGMAGSLAVLFMQSDLEELAEESSGLSDTVLRARWKAIAEKIKIERRTGAVFNGLLGATSIVLGGLAFDGKIGELTDEQRKIVGSALVGGGAFGVSHALVDWFVPRPEENGYALVSQAPTCTFVASPTPNGAHIGVQGTF